MQDTVHGQKVGLPMHVMVYMMLLDMQQQIKITRAGTGQPTITLGFSLT